jgi:predicted DNA repair protein MutK
MFMVGGGILVHGVPGAEELVHALSEPLHGVPGIGGMLSALAGAVINGIFGMIAGAFALLGLTVGARAYRAARGRPAARDQPP